MTDDLAVRIAAMVSELGKLRTQVKAIPTDAQAEVMREVCSPNHARDAMHLALGLVVETTDVVARPLVDVMMQIAGLLAPLHKDSVNRKVSRADVFRMMADLAEREDSARSIVDSLKALLGPVVPKPPDEGTN